MIPRLDQLEPVRAATRAFLAALEASRFEGDVRPDAATRLVAATDNSVYQILPQAVVFPRSTADVARVMGLLAEPRFRGLTVAPRGGGTGTNGQSLNEGVILDVSRHMDRILGLDLEAGEVRVQPGVVLDQLNAFLRPHGVFFAPTVSPSSRATLGGMINTDASGKGSRVYGKTSQHVLGLTTVLADGTVWEAEELPLDALPALAARGDLVGAVHRAVDAACAPSRALFDARYPRLQRFLTGYNLPMVRDEARGTFNLCWLLCGSEGTLGVVTEARLRVTPIPRHRKLVVLKFATFDDALGSAEEVVRSDPSAIETVDEVVMGLARQDVIWHDVREVLEPPAGEPPLGAVNLVEYAGADAAEVEARVEALVRDVAEGAGQPGRPVGFHVARDAAEAEALWSLRKKGVGLLGNAPGARKPIAFVEDTVVPPERLRDYIRDFRAILDEAGLSYGMFGHIDVGCLHVRPALDMKDPGDERLLRQISDRVARLALSYGGVIWGEHGKGLRSEYNPLVFGDEVYALFRRVKAAFDPHNQLNPGKIAVPEGHAGALTPIDAIKRGAFDRQIPPPARARWDVALSCNGNGQCFDWDADHVMCPSSKVTRDRIHSPKGRAGVMREWLRQLAVAGHDPLAELARPAPLAAAPFRWLARAWRTAARALGRYDYSHEVYGAMAGCLACKACATRCPIKVDVPSFRADFLALYHTRYLRPLRDGLVGRLESVLPWMARLPRVVNALMGLAPVRWLLGRVVGLVDTPPLATETAARGLAARGLRPVGPADLAALDPDERARTVAVLQDGFTTFYEPRVLLAAVDLLRELGYAPRVLAYRPSGKGLHVKGFLARFRRLAARNAAFLAEVAATGVPIVGLDPAVVLALRDEYPHALGAEACAYRVQLLQEWLAEAFAGRAPAAAAAPGAPWTLYGHCTERTAEPASQRQWQQVFRAVGQELRVLELGCCGMCGAYGHEAVHLEESRGIFAMSWARHLPEGPGDRARVLATGHSCRSQTKRFAGFVPRHPAEALLEALREGREGASDPPRLSRT